MVFSLFYQEIIGVVSLSFIPLIFYYQMPVFMSSWMGIFLCSLGVGCYILIQQYVSTSRIKKQLQFEPNEQQRKKFEAQIEEAGMYPSKISLRYGYSDTSVAQTVFDTIIVDQMLWKGIKDDESFLNAQKVIQAYILPSVSLTKKKFHEKLNESLTEPVQRFIFKHELGHVKDHYSYKKIALTGVLTFLVAFLTFTCVSYLLPLWNGLLVYVFAVFLAGLLDLFFNLSSNLVFKVRKEVACDVFASQYCTKEEILAAANFFEIYEEDAKVFRKESGESFSDMAPRFFMGYYPGNERAQYLRKLARSK